MFLSVNKTVTSLLSNRSFVMHLNTVTAMYCAVQYQWLNWNWYFNCRFDSCCVASWFFYFFLAICNTQYIFGQAWCYSSRSPLKMQIRWFMDIQESLYFYICIFYVISSDAVGLQCGLACDVFDRQTHSAMGPVGASYRYVTWTQTPSSSCSTRAVKWSEGRSLLFGDRDSKERK
jgi:hypothetical protein